MEVAPKYFTDFAEVMNRRFDGVDEKLDIIATTVLRHDEMLQCHSDILKKIVDTQAEHSHTLAAHTILLGGTEDRHSDHEERISHLERSVTRLRLKIDN